MVALTALVVLTGCTSEPEFSDGTWRFVGDSSEEHGWTPVLLVEVEGGDVARARYDFLSADGVYLSEDYEALRIRSHAENIDLEQALLLLTEAFEEQPKVDVEADGPTWLMRSYNSLTRAFIARATEGEPTDEAVVVDVSLQSDGLDPAFASNYLSF